MVKPLECDRRVLEHQSPLNHLQNQRIWRELLEKSDDINDASPSDTMVYLVARVLANTQLLTDDQFWLLLSEAKTMLSVAGSYLSQAIIDEDTTSTLYQVAFADRHYATWTGKRGWLSLEFGDWQDEIRAPIETISYNLQSIALDGVRMIEAFQSATESTDDTHRRSAE